MPVVKVDWLEGRNDSVKEKLIKGIADAFDSVGVDGNKVHIIINDIPKSNWGHNKKSINNLESE